jgi:hypothetical protein
MISATDAAGILLDEEDPHPIRRYSVAEARGLDLHGARRVELWACESGRGDPMIHRVLLHDEPGGMDAAVLLAGASCAVGSLWTQYVLSTAMIAEAFSLTLAHRPQPEGEALASAVRRYRDALAPDGAFSCRVEEFVTATPGPTVHVEAALRAGLDAWRTALWRELAGATAPPLGDDCALDGARLGPSLQRNRALPGRGAELAAQILAPYRSVLAWGGWRVTLRSKEVLDAGQSQGAKA